MRSFLRLFGSSDASLGKPSNNNRRKRRRQQRTRSLRIEGLEGRQMLSAVSMTDQEQLLLELVNRARHNPLAEAATYGIDLNQGLPGNTISSSSKQPLAPNQSLIDAARLHSQDMLDQDYFDHVNLSGDGPLERVTAAGYSGLGVGENIAWGGSTGSINQNLHVYDRHRALFLSPGHRVNLLEDAFDQLGTGVRYGVFTTEGTNYNSSMVTEKFGISDGVTFVTGVAYSDSVEDNNFYDIGESQAGVVVRAVTAAGAIFETTTGPSGGYALAVPAGTYTVYFVDQEGGRQVVVESVAVEDINVKVDLDTGDADWASIMPEITTEIQLDRDLGLSHGGNDFLNWGGWQEKWMQGSNGAWFFITPSGRLHQWNRSNFQSSPEVAVLSAQNYTDTSRLHFAFDTVQARYADADSLVPRSSSLRFDESLVLSISSRGVFENFSGFGEKWVQAATGTWYTVRPSGDFYQWHSGATFSWLGRIESAAHTYVERLAYATEFTAEIIELDRLRDFRILTQDHFNWGGLQEKWVYSVAQGWHYLTPSGALYQWHGGSVQNRTLVAQLSSAVHQHTLLLTRASL